MRRGELGGALASPRTHVESMRVRIFTASIAPYFFRAKRVAMFRVVLEEINCVLPKAAPKSLRPKQTFL